MTRRGVTLVEVLIVMAILHVLAGLWFGLSPGVHESANQRACASNMRQVYLGLSLYSADHDHGSAYPELFGWSYVCEPFRFDSGGKPTFLIGTRDLYMCPSAPGWLKERVLKTLMSMVEGCLTMDGGSGGPLATLATGDRLRATNLERAEKYGPELPVLYCEIHDEFVVAPRERNIDPAVAVPHIVSVNASGKLTVGRDPRFTRTEFWSKMVH